MKKLAILVLLIAGCERTTTLSSECVRGQIDCVCYSDGTCIGNMQCTQSARDIYGRSFCRAVANSAVKL